MCDASRTMFNSDDIAIIVLNWNRREETRRCVESCPASQRIYVLNNGCVHDEEYVSNGRDRLTVTNSPTNIGFAAGVNLLAARALWDGAEWLLLLNNDATLEPGAVEALAAATAPGIAAVCPMVIDASSGRVWSVGGRVSARTGRVSSEYHDFDPDEVPVSPKEVDFGTGACLLVSAQAMRQIGGLDATYFAYWEETDWCRRAWDARFRVVTCPLARTVHVGGASSTPSLRLYLLIRGAFLYMRRHCSPGELVRFLPVFILWTMPSWSFRPFVANPMGTARAIYRALEWHARHAIPDPDVRLPPVAVHRGAAEPVGR
jgi:GT2 family glycosyltransferase